MITLKDALTEKGLTTRECEVAELVAKGLSNNEVANQLFITEKTVKFHLEKIYEKMNVKSRAQMIVWCLPHLLFPMSRDHVRESAETLINQSLEELRQMESIYGGVVIEIDSHKREVRIVGSDNLSLKTIVKFDSIDSVVNLDDVVRDVTDILSREHITVMAMSEFKTNVGI